MVKKSTSIVIALVLMLALLVPACPALAASPTTSITIIKYDSDGITILNQVTVTWEWMKANLPVQGDGVTHYYHQGPTFDPNDLWDPDETVNIDSRDYGAAKGTDVKDLCELVGGASDGDTIKVKAADNFVKWFDYPNVYTPEPRQGKMVITWYTADTQEGPDGYVPDYASGMRLVFFAGTVNSQGKHVFGNWDMHETLAESRWHYYYDGKFWPSSSGLSVKYVRYIEIYSGGTGMASDSLVATANVVLNRLGIALDHDSIDFGNIKPGQSSAIKPVRIINTGTLKFSVTMEIQSDNTTAHDFYEQSLYIDNKQYNIASVIAIVPAGNSQGIDTQLKVPASWYEPGQQQAVFTFWAEASP
jgi:hypothetical protein